VTIVEKKVRRIRWRLEWLNFCRRFVRTLLLALFLLAAYVAASKFAKLPWDIATAASVLAGATIPVALVWAFLTHTNLRDAAIAADQRLNLRERLSTALAIGPPSAPMETAAYADAEAHARGLRAHCVFPMPVWREIYYLPVPILLAVAIGLFVPEHRFLGREEKKSEKPLPTAQQVELAKRLDGFQRALKKMPANAPPIQMRELSRDLEQLVRDLKSKRLSQSDVLKKLSRISDRVAERKAAMEKKLEAARKVERFRSAEMTKKMADAIARGNFDAAEKELKKIAEKLKSGELSEKERKKLASELQGLSDALRDNPELSKALEEIAKNLDAGDLESALANIQLSAEKLQDLAETLREMAQLDQVARCLGGLKAGCCNSSGAGACDYAALLETLAAAYKKGKTDEFGPGMKGAGRGAGGRAPIEETPTKMQKTMARMKLDKGDVLGVVRVMGPQIKGKATEKFEKVYIEYRQSAEEALARENVPLEYRTLVRDYFDAIRPATAAKKPRAVSGESNSPPSKSE